MKTLQDILNKIPLETQQLLKRASKKAMGIQWVEHSPELGSIRLIEYCKSLPPSPMKTRLLFVANFIGQHPEMCYPDFIDYFDNVKGWKMLDYKLAFMDCFKNDPYVIKLYRRYDSSVPE